MELVTPKSISKQNKDGKTKEGFEDFLDNISDQEEDNN